MSFPPRIIRQAKKRARGVCEGCGMPTGPSNPAEVHHRDATWKRDGKPDQSLENALCLGQKCCHRAISIQDAKIRAAADRQSRVIQGGKKSKWRALPGTKRSGWRKRMDGRVERR